MNWIQYIKTLRHENARIRLETMITNKKLDLAIKLLLGAVIVAYVVKG